MACLNASFQSGVIYARRFWTTCGVCRAASKFWNPPSPARCIHSRSAVMPSLLMLPFIQCHQTRGRAPLGGFSKPLRRASAEACPQAAPAAKAIKTNESDIHRLHVQSILFSPTTDGFVSLRFANAMEVGAEFG